LLVWTVISRAGWRRPYQSAAGRLRRLPYRAEARRAHDTWLPDTSASARLRAFATGTGKLDGPRDAAAHQAQRCPGPASTHRPDPAVTFQAAARPRGLPPDVRSEWLTDQAGRGCCQGFGKIAAGGVRWGCQLYARFVRLVFACMMRRKRS